MFRKLIVLLVTCLLVSAWEFMCQVSVNAAWVRDPEKKFFKRCKLLFTSL
ncbi:MAG: hypothetical protein U0Z17_03220 [Bacteroidales bacterium]